MARRPSIKARPGRLATRPFSMNSVKCVAAIVAGLDQPSDVAVRGEVEWPRRLEREAQPPLDLALDPVETPCRRSCI